MTELQTWWAAAGGQAPPRELVEAQRGLTRAQRRAARRAVRRGEAVADPAAARLAVAQARVVVRRRPGAWLIAFFALLVAGWVAFAVAQLTSGHPVLGAFFAATAVFGAWVLYRLHPRYVRAARLAERRNREALEQAGQPYPDDPAAAEPVQPPASALAAAAVALWAFYDLIFGILSDLIDGRGFDLAHAVARGAFFATGMTVVNLTVLRRRTERQSQRPIGD